MKRSISVDANIFIPNQSDKLNEKLLFTLPTNNNKNKNLENPVASFSHTEGYSLIKDLRVSNINRIIIGHLNVNSIRNKFENLMTMIQGNIDILFISETKIDDTFPTSQFTIEGYLKPIRLDRNEYGGGIMLFIREDIPCKEIKSIHDFLSATIPRRPTLQSFLEMLGKI